VTISSIRRLVGLILLAVLVTRCGKAEDAAPASSVEADRDIARRLDDLAKRVEALEEGLKGCREALEGLRTADGEPSVRLPSPRLEKADSPILEGRVLAADNGADVVVISRGSEDGVRVGSRYTISRGVEYITLIEIIDLEDHKAAGRSVRGLRRKDVVPGDRVMSQ